MAIKLKVSSKEPEKKTKVRVSSPKATPADVEAANRFAKDFALRKGMISGENTHTGGVVPPFVDPAGRPYMPPKDVAPVGMLSNKVPSEVTSLEWDDKANLPYYIDPKSGDSKYVAKELFYSQRFRRSNTGIENPLGNIIVKR
jgi:hypothetical protein